MTTTATEMTLSRQATEARAAAPAVLAPVPQYATGFEGAASAPFSPEAAAVLAAPVNELEVEIREDGVVYLPGVAYRRILTRAFGAGAWALLPRGPARTMGDLVVYHGALYVLGRFVSEAVGECQTRFGMSYASSLEGARTDCLTRCCKDLGMATELWDPAWRESWQAKYADKEWKPPVDNKKGRWSWKLKAKATNATVLEGRNVGAPKGETPPGAATVGQSTAEPTNAGAASEKTPAMTTTGATPRNSASNPATSDTGEAPGVELIAQLQKAVAALRWPAPRRKNWLLKHFGVDSSTRLTKRQAEDALSLLQAAALDDMDKEYGERYTKLRDAGRVK